MLYVLPTLVGALAVAVVTAAYRLGRGLTRSRAMQAGAARMPAGAAHEFA